MKYTGSCHCHNVEFEFHSNEIDSGLSCNCSHCRRIWFVLHFIPESDFISIKEDVKQTEYRFHTKTIEHKFCPICGVSCYSKGVNPDGTISYGINLNCVDQIDTWKLKINTYNWKDL